MKVLLVNPPRFEGLSVIREERCEITERYSVLEPYSLLQIGALLRKDGHDVRLLDLNGFDQSYEELSKNINALRPEAVVFRFTPTTLDHDMRTATEAKSIDRSIRTVSVCWTLRTMPQQVMSSTPDLDVYARTDYEVVVPEVINALAAGKDLASVKGIAFRDGTDIKLTEKAVPLKDYESIPIPAYDLLPNLDPYYITAPAGKPFTIMYTSKGCPFNCVFCTVAGTPWRPRSAESVLEELRFLKASYGIKTVSFFDETFTLDKKRVLAMAKALIEEDFNIRWYCNTRVHLVDRDLLRQMHQAGCRGISYGVESGSQTILDRADKCLKVDQARQAIRWAKEAHIKTLCSFIIGLPGETWETVNETIAFVNETIPTSAQFNVAVPYPGTKLYEMVYGDQVRVLDIRRLFQDEAVVGTEAMTPEELNRARMMAYRSLYANPKWWMSNLKHVLTNPEDLNLATRYALKIANNYLVHHMEDAH